MKKLGLFMCFMLLIGGVSMAQNRGGDRQQATPEQRAKMRTEHLTKQLSLNDEQKQKVYDLSLEQSKKMTNTEQDRQKRMEAMQAARKDFNDKLLQILTPEQKTKWEEIQAQQRERMGDRSRRGPRNR